MAGRLRVRKSTLDDLLALDTLQAGLGALPPDARPSRIVAVLEPLAPRVLLTARMLDAGEPCNGWLERYVTEWRHVRTVITGDDLRAAGLPPGPAYTRILDRLLAARLDGEVSSETEERALYESLLAAEVA